MRRTQLISSADSSKKKKIPTFKVRSLEAKDVILLLKDLKEKVTSSKNPKTDKYTAERQDCNTKLRYQELQHTQTQKLYQTNKVVLIP